MEESDEESDEEEGGMKLNERLTDVKSGEKFESHPIRRDENLHTLNVIGIHHQIFSYEGSLATGGLVEHHVV